MDQNSSNLSTSPGNDWQMDQNISNLSTSQERLAMDQNSSNLSTSPGTIGNGPE